MLSLTAFKTMNTMVAVLCSERDFWLSIGHKIALAYSPEHSVHYAGSLSNTEWLLDWLGKDKMYQQALSTNTGHACSVKMALVKLDP